MKAHSLLIILSAVALNSISAQPYQGLTLKEEINAGAAPASVWSSSNQSGRYESNGSDSVQTLLGQPVRVTNGPTGWFGYKLGSNLQYDKPYVIEVVYPEDTPRAYLMALMDNGGYQPGSHYAFHTGVYESETYQPEIKNGAPNTAWTPNNVVAYPLRQQFKSFWIVAWPQPQADWRAQGGYDQFPNTHGHWSTGLWLYFINKSDDPNNHGVAVKTIRIYDVASVEDLIDPAVDNLRVNSPRKTFWTLESGQNTTESSVARARIFGANTLVPSPMPWNFLHSGGEWPYYRAQLELNMRNIFPAARRHRMGIIPNLEYGGSPFLPVEAQGVTSNNLRYQDDYVPWGHSNEGKDMRVNPRMPAAHDELKHMIDVVFEVAGPDADLIKGVMIRNRIGLIAPSFSNADIDAFETETGHVIFELEADTPIPNESKYEKKRRAIRKWVWKPGNKEIGVRHTEEYMQWHYKNVADYLEDAQQYLKATYGNDKVLIYIPFSGEGIFRPGMSNPPENFFAHQEWGWKAGMNADKNYLTLIQTDQHWNAGVPGFLNAMNSLGGQATMIDPMYVEFGWAGFPYAKIAPGFEHGGQEYSVRSEILVMANTNPRLLGKFAFRSINRGSPEHWNAFAKNFYMIPDEVGTTLSDTTNVTVKTYSSGRVLVINKSLVSQTVNLSGTYPTLYNKITGASVNTSAIPVGACSMQMFGTQSGGLPAYSVLPQGPPSPPRNVVQFEDGTVGGGAIVNNNSQPQSVGTHITFSGGTGSWVEVNLNAPASGQYDLKIRYALAPNNGLRPMQITLNNAVISASEPFPVGYHWRDFRYHMISGVSLNEGNNTLRLQPAENSGPSMDQVEVISQTAEGNLFFDDFASGAGAWSLGTNSPWSIALDAGDAAYNHIKTSTNSAVNLAGSNWANYEVALDVKFSDWDTWSHTSIYSSYSDANNRYRLALQRDQTYNSIRLYKRIGGGSETQIGAAWPTLAWNTWYVVKLKKDEGQLTVKLNDAAIITVQDAAPLPAGKIGLSAAKQAVRIDNVAVTSVGAVPDINLALNKPTVASTNTGTSQLINDGNLATRWGSTYANNQWIYIDLGQTREIRRVVLKWETAYASSYRIEVSNNATTWTQIYSTTTGQGGVEDLTNLTGSGRYVRLYCVQRATGWGNSLWEMEVLGPP